MYTSQIIVPFDKNLELLFVPEDKDLGRAKYSIKKVSKNLIFDINAEDSTALKTAVNTICKVLMVWEKT